MAMIPRCAMILPLPRPRAPCPQLLGFCLFECCVGVYFPTWGSLRSTVVPEVPSTVQCVHVHIALWPPRTWSVAWPLISSITVLSCHFAITHATHAYPWHQECRSAIMNLFRVPLNLIVVLILINIDWLKGQQVGRAIRASM